MSANPYGVSTIHETCQCGAKFDWQGDTWLGKCAVEKFRKDHLVCRNQPTLCALEVPHPAHKWDTGPKGAGSCPGLSEESRT